MNTRIHIINIKSSTYIDFDIENKDFKFMVSDYVTMPKYLWLKHLCLWLKMLQILCRGEEIIGTFYEKELQETNQTEIKVETIIKRKGNKLYIKLKGCH